MGEMSTTYSSKICDERTVRVNKVEKVLADQHSFTNLFAMRQGRHVSFHAGEAFQLDPQIARAVAAALVDAEAPGRWPEQSDLLIGRRDAEVAVFAAGQLYVLAPDVAAHLANALKRVADEVEAAQAGEGST